MSSSRLAAGLAAPGGARGKLAILIYHRVLPRADAIFPEEVDAATFEMHLGVLASGFNVLPLAEALARLRQGDLPPRAVAITFDDGYADNAEIALPILRRYGLNATFFIAAGFLDGGCMWNDRLIEAVRALPGARCDLSALGLGVHDMASPPSRRVAIKSLINALKYLPQAERDARVDEVCAALQAARPTHLMMRAEQVRELSDAGMGVGGHTMTHPILARLDATAAQNEIAAGKAAIEAIVGSRITLFAYPNGKPNQDYVAQHVELVRACGFEAAVSTAWGAATRTSDFFQLPRFTPWDCTPRKFAWRLATNYLRRQREFA